MIPFGPNKSGYVLMETSEGLSSLYRQANPKEECVFRWNGRECHGSRLHLAARDGDMEGVKLALKESHTSLFSRFTYETRSPTDQPQEGSGEAIHLAASKGRDEVVRYLVAQRANISSKVTRGGADHYNVLHAAVYAEGSAGGSASVVSFLLSQSADPETPNQDGWTALHLAYQTGSIHLIQLLHQAIPDWHAFEEACVREAHPLPLEFGIHFFKMSEEELAETAQLTLRSLHCLMEHMPHGLPRFLQRVATEGQLGMDGKSMAEVVKAEDIANLLRESPEAACALLDYCSLQPEVMSGHNPLPTRVSFAPRTWTQWLQTMLNLQNDLLVFHIADQVWDYDDVIFKMPPWQRAITENHEERVRTRRRRRLMAERDAEISVCHVPNLITAEYFQAIIEAADADPEYFRFKNVVVRSSIHYAFWHGACIYDLLQVAVSFWAVLILVFETSMLVLERNSPESAHPRELRPSGGGAFLEDMEGGPGHLLRDLQVATSWIAARGFVDFLMEVVQFLGLCAIGRPSSYVTWGNLLDVIRSVLTFMLFLRPESKTVNIVVIFFLWLRLLEIFTTAEKVARAILPIRDLAKGLVPALVVFGIGYCAFVHAFFAVQDTAQPNWAQVFHSSFSTLITASLPENVAGVPVDQLWLCYLAVLMFSIFFLNIFIGVIGELYQVEKMRSELTFQELRCQSVLSFQLRALILPCALCDATVAQGIALASFCVIAGTQMFCIITRQWFPFLPLPFTLLQIAMVTCVFQCPQEAWASSWFGRHSNGEKRYLWICRPKAEQRKEVRMLTTEEIESFMRQRSAESAGDPRLSAWSSRKSRVGKR